jgi:hypothetical protein
MNAAATELSRGLAELMPGFAHAELVQSVLARVSTKAELIRFIHRYTLFNGNFAGGVVNLAGALHVRQDLFRDPTEPVSACADRGARIASHVFFAAEDEYFDRDDRRRITHRDLGQYVLKEAIDWLGFDAHTFDRDFPLNASTRDALAQIFTGYCIHADARSEDDLCRGLGFHIASETSADAEFNALKTYLHQQHPALVQRLTDASTHLGHSIFGWIGLHTFVEVEHHEHALTAASMALDYYSGQLSRAHAEARIVEGVHLFSSVLNRLMSGILVAD